jgi:phage gp45-like
VSANTERIAAQEIALSGSTSNAGGIEQVLQKVNLPAVGGEGTLTRTILEKTQAHVSSIGQKMILKSGRQVHLSGGEDKELLVVHNPQGEIELSVHFTAAGPVLNFSAAAFNLQTPGEVKIDCRKLQVNSTEAIELNSGGDMVQKINGEKKTQVRGKSFFEAHTINMKTRRGNINAKANDDVCINGERIKLNS